MEDIRNERVKDESEKWFVPSSPVRSVWAIQRAGVDYAFRHIREKNSRFSAQKSVKKNKKLKKCFITWPANVLSKCSGRYFAPPLPFANKLNDDDLQHIKLTIGIKNDCYEMFSTVLRLQDCMFAHHVHKILGMTGRKQNCFEWLLDAALTCCLCVNSSYESGVSRVHKRVMR